MLQQVVHIFTMGLGTLWVLLKAHVLIFLWEDGERSPATSWVHYTTSSKHSLVLLKMGEIIARYMLC